MLRFQSLEKGYFLSKAEILKELSLSNGSVNMESGDRKPHSENGKIPQKNGYNLRKRDVGAKVENGHL